jgi:hypothetical protein
MYNIDFTEYDRTFSKNAVILEKCSFRDNDCVLKFEVFKLLWNYQLKIQKQQIIVQRRNLKSRLFKELNQPIDYTPKYTFKR